MKGINTQSLVFLFLVFMAIIIFGITKPKPTDWRYSFSLEDKNPFGLEVFHNETDKIFSKNDDLSLWHEELLNMDIDDFYADIEFIETDEDKVTMIYVNNTMNLDSIMVKKILTSVAHGHNAFISSTELPNFLADTLGIVVFSQFNTEVYYRDSLNYTLTHFDKVSLNDNVGVNGSYIYKFDTLNTRILGYVNQDSMRPNFALINYGLGYICLHTEPVLLTNYHMLNGDNYKYSEALMSYLPQSSPLVWAQPQSNKNVIKGGVLRYIMSQPSLKWAWFILLMGVLLFILTYMRRPQRIIPIIRPTENATLKFVGSIGDLYMRKASIRQLIDRKIIYLLERIRSQYYISTDSLDDGFTLKLAQMSGKSLESVKHLVFLVTKHRESDYNCTADDLRRLNQAIENFYS